MRPMRLPDGSIRKRRRSIDAPGDNVSGTSDLTPVDEQIELLTQAIADRYITEKDLLSLRSWREDPANWTGSGSKAQKATTEKPTSEA